MIAAAIDLGTNSFRLLIASQGPEGLVPRRKELMTTRLGEGLAATGKIGSPAIERSIAALKQFQAIMAEEGVEVSRAVATSAVREAANQAEFLSAIQDACRFQVEVVSGLEEAALSYQGVVRGLGLDSPPLVVDLGGGSTEFICLDSRHALEMSLAVGAVRATEGDWAAPDIRAMLEPLLAFEKKLAAYPLVFVGGTATSLAAVQMGLVPYDPGRVHGHTLFIEQVRDLYQRLYRVPLSQRRQIAGLQPERADIIVKGALIVLEIMIIMGRDRIQVSETDILEGIIYAMAEF